MLGLKMRIKKTKLKYICGLNFTYHNVDFDPGTVIILSQTSRYLVVVIHASCIPECPFSVGRIIPWPSQPLINSSSTMGHSKQPKMRHAYLRIMTDA